MRINFVFCAFKNLVFAHIFCTFVVHKSSDGSHRFEQFIYDEVSYTHCEEVRASSLISVC